jgi:hypothetical protein
MSDHERVFGVGVKFDAEGNPVEVGIGSKLPVSVRCQQEAPTPAPFAGATRPPSVSAFEMSFALAAVSCYRPARSFSRS